MTADPNVYPYAADAPALDPHDPMSGDKDTGCQQAERDPESQMTPAPIQFVPDTWAPFEIRMAALQAASRVTAAKGMDSIATVEIAQKFETYLKGE